MHLSFFGEMTFFGISTYFRYIDKFCAILIEHNFSYFKTKCEKPNSTWNTKLIQSTRATHFAQSPQTTIILFNFAIHHCQHLSPITQPWVRVLLKRTNDKFPFWWNKFLVRVVIIEHRKYDNRSARIVKISISTSTCLAFLLIWLIQGEYGYDVILMLDTSGSMYGEKLSHAVDALKSIIQNLPEADNFNIIRYGNKVCEYF